jgi:hypothetical protein
MLLIAALVFKNYVNKHWYRIDTMQSQWLINDEDKQAIRDLIVGAIGDCSMSVK